MHPFNWLSLLVLLWALVSSTGVAAVDFEKLVMPGPLIEGHADLEGECTSCHQPFERERQRLLCLACHDDVAADLDRKVGLHGRLPSVQGSRCRDCHTDHKGRDAEIVDLDPETFEHRFTDFALHGAHVGVACKDCHEPEKQHRDASLRCAACHGDDDPHGGVLGDDCASCHVDEGWDKTKFDHDATDFALKGAHQKVACALCHPAERYEGTPSDCRSCHATNDVHRGEFGRDCARCHESDAWDRSRFDHAEATGYALRDRHAKVACRACHTGPLEEQKLDTRCVSCHVSDDIHRGRNGSDCAKCHDTRSWRRVAFDHDRSTDFPLLGKHADLSCQRCHRTDPHKEKLGMTCITCHRADDAHAGSQGEGCEKCHNAEGWRSKVFFDHELTRFPLLGLHAAVACESCHASTHFRDTEIECFACHEADDAHDRKLGSDCGRCHNPNSWSLWRFDHEGETKFPLRGAHEGLNCLGCHTRPMRGAVRQASECAACHAFDDAHNGGFGRDCGRCHNDVRWNDVSMGSSR